MNSLSVRSEENKSGGFVATIGEFVKSIRGKFRKDQPTPSNDEKNVERGTLLSHSKSLLGGSFEKLSLLAKHLSSILLGFNLHVSCGAYEKDVRLRLFRKTYVDIDGDGKNDIYARLLIYPSILFDPPSLALNYKLYMKKLSDLKSNGRDFELYVELYLPTYILLKEKSTRIRYGFVVSDSQSIPEKCTITYQFIPHLLSFFGRKPEASIVVDPEGIDKNARLATIFSYALYNTTSGKICKEFIRKVEYYPATSARFVVNEDIDSTDGNFVIEVERSTRVISENTISNYEKGESFGWGVIVEKLPKKVKFDYQYSVHPFSEGTKFEYHQVEPASSLKVIAFIKNGVVSKIFKNLSYCYVKYVPMHFRFSSHLLTLHGRIDLSTFDDSIEEFGWCDDLSDPSLKVFFADLPKEGRLEWNLTLTKGCVETFVGWSGASFNIISRDPDGDLINLSLSSQKDLDIKCRWDLSEGYLMIDRDSGFIGDLNLKVYVRYPHGDTRGVFACEAVLKRYQKRPFKIIFGGTYPEKVYSGCIFESGLDFHLSNLYLKLDKWVFSGYDLGGTELSIDRLDFSHQGFGEGSVAIYPAIWYQPGSNDNTRYLIKNGYVRISVSENCSADVDGVHGKLVIKEISLPTVNITSIDGKPPEDGMTVSGVVKIKGIATAASDDRPIKYVEVRIDDEPWMLAQGTNQWSFKWDTTKYREGYHEIRARAWDGEYHSPIVEGENYFSKIYVKNSEGGPSDDDHGGGNSGGDDHSGGGSGGGNSEEGETKLFVNITHPSNNQELPEGNERVVIINGTAGGVNPIKKIEVSIYRIVTYYVVPVEILVERGEATGTINWRYTWNIEKVPDGSYLIEAVCVDESNDTTSAQVKVKIQRDKPLLPPEVNITNIPMELPPVKVSDIVRINGTASSSDADRPIKKVEIAFVPVLASIIKGWEDILGHIGKLNLSSLEWKEVVSENGFSKWYYEWDTSDIPWGIYLVFARSVDSKGIYSDPAIVVVEVNNLNISLIKKSVALEFYLSESSSIRVSNVSIGITRTSINGTILNATLSFNTFSWKSKEVARFYVTWDSENKTFGTKLCLGKREASQNNITFRGVMFSAYLYGHKNGEKVDLRNYFIVKVNKLILKTQGDTLCTGLRFSFVKNLMNGSLCVRLSGKGGTIDITGVYFNWNGWIYSDPDIHFSGSDLEISFALQLGVGEDILRYWIPNEFTGWVSIGSKENNFTFDGAVDLIIPGGIELQVGGKIHFYSKDGELNISWNLKREEWAKADLVFVDGYGILEIEDFYMRVSYANNLSAILDIHIFNLSADGSEYLRWVFDVNNENTSLKVEDETGIGGPESVFSVNLAVEFHTGKFAINSVFSWAGNISAGINGKTSLYVVFETKPITSVLNNLMEMKLEEASKDLIRGLKILNITGDGNGYAKTINSAHLRVTISYNNETVVYEEKEKTTNVTTPSNETTLTTTNLSENTVTHIDRGFVKGGMDISRLEIEGRCNKFVVDANLSTGSDGKATLHIYPDGNVMFLLKELRLYGKGWGESKDIQTKVHETIIIVETIDSNSTNRTILENTTNIWENKTVNRVTTFADGGVSIGRIGGEAKANFNLDVNFSFNETGNVKLFLHRDPADIGSNFSLKELRVYGKGWKESNYTKTKVHETIIIVETIDSNSTNRTILENTTNIWENKTVNRVTTFADGGVSIGRIGGEAKANFNLDVNFSFNETGNVKLFLHRDPADIGSNFSLKELRVYGKGWKESNYTKTKVHEEYEDGSDEHVSQSYRYVTATNQTFDGEFNVSRFEFGGNIYIGGILDINISWNSTGITGIKADVDENREMNILLLLEGLHLNVSGRKEEYTETPYNREKKLLSHFGIVTDLSGEFNLSSGGNLFLKYNRSKGELVFEKENIDEVTISEPYFYLYIDWDEFWVTTELSANEIYLLADELHAYINSSTRKINIILNSGFRVRNGSFMFAIPMPEVLFLANKTLLITFHSGDLSLLSGYLHISGHYTQDQIHTSFLGSGGVFAFNAGASLGLVKGADYPINSSMQNTFFGFQLTLHRLFFPQNRRGYLNISYQKNEFLGENIITVSGDNIRIVRESERSFTFDLIINGTKAFTWWRGVNTNYNATKDWKLVAKWKGNIQKPKLDYAYIDYYADKEITGSGNIYSYEENSFIFLDYFDIACEVNFTDDKSVHHEAHIYWKPNDFTRGYGRINYTGKAESTSWCVRLSHRIGGAWFEMKTGKITTKKREFSFGIDFHYNLDEWFVHGNFGLRWKSKSDTLWFGKLILKLSNGWSSYNKLEIGGINIPSQGNADLQVNGSYHVSSAGLTLSVASYINIQISYIDIDVDVSEHTGSNILHMENLRISGDISINWDQSNIWKVDYISLLSEDGVTFHLGSMRLGCAVSGNRTIIRDLDASICGDIIVENLSMPLTELRISTSRGINGNLVFKLWKWNEGNYYRCELNGSMSPGSYLVGKKEVPGYNEGGICRFGGDLNLGKLSIKKEENGEEKDIVDMNPLTVDTNGGYFELGWGKRKDQHNNWINDLWIRTEGVTNVTFLSSHLYGYWQNGMMVWNITITNITLSSFTAKKIKYSDHPDSDIKEATEVYLDGDLSVTGGIDGIFIIKEETSSEEVLSFKPYASYGLWINATQAKIGWANSKSDPEDKTYLWITTNGYSTAKGAIQIGKLSISGVLVVDGSVRILHNKNWVYEKFDGTYDCKGGSLTIASNFSGAYSRDLQKGRFGFSVYYDNEYLFNLGAEGYVEMNLPPDTEVITGIGEYVDCDHSYKGFYLDINGGNPRISLIFGITTSLFGEMKFKITGYSISASDLRIEWLVRPNKVGGSASSNMMIFVWDEDDSEWDIIWPTGDDSDTLTAQAYVEPNSGPVDTTFHFQGEAYGGEEPYTYYWEFGDGNSAYGQDVDYQYSEPGTYTATLTVTDNEGNTANATVSVTVNEPGYSVELEADPENAMVGSTITFTATVSGGSPDYTYEFDFGDGHTHTETTPSTTYSVQHTYYSPGVYNVTVTVTDGNGNVATDYVNVTIWTWAP